MTDINKIHVNYIKRAWVSAELSKDPNTKVGAVIVTRDYSQESTGRNGFPRGIDESGDRWNRPNKYEYVIHAEENAILNAKFDVRGCILYVTHMPCHRCLARIIQSDIHDIYYNLEYSNLTNVDIHADLARYVNITRINI